MQITCKVNQAEAIRRGIDTSSTVKLEIDPAILNEAQRRVLADKFVNGELRDLELKEPTFAGLLEALDNRIEWWVAEQAKLKEENDKYLAEARRIFDTRAVKVFDRLVGARMGADGPEEVDSHCRATHSSSYNETCAGSGFMGNVVQTELNRLMATPGGLAWQAEMDAGNAREKDKARAEAFARVLKEETKRQAKETRAAETLEYQRQIITDFGTAMQRERLVRNLIDVDAESREILRLKIEGPRGLEDARPYDSKDDYTELETLTDGQMELLLAFEELNNVEKVTFYDRKIAADNVYGEDIEETVREVDVRVAFGPLAVTRSFELP